MRKLKLIICVLLLFGANNVYGWDLKDALKDLGKDSSGAGGRLGSALGNLLSTDKMTLKQMEGTWGYSAPAVTFKSDNVVKRAGGAAASGMIVEKLKPIYARVGFDKSKLTVSADSSFVLSAGKITLKGTISDVSDKDSDANFVFHFSVGGKLKIGEADAYVTKSATGVLSVMFDVTKLIAIMETAGKISGNSTLKSAVDLLESYDGLCAGFAMKQIGKASSK